MFNLANEKSLCIKQVQDPSKNFIVKAPYGECCLIDYMNLDILEFVKKEIIHSKKKGFKKNAINLLMNEPSHLCNGDCYYKNISDNKIQLPFTPGVKGNRLDLNTLPLDLIQNKDENLSLLNTHNLYSLQESKNHFTAMYDSGVKRPMVFSRSIFPGSQQYTGKWLGYIEASWLGLKMSLVQTILNNVNIIN
jgi:alpha-glucosidase (family GH31 glycosyl hydrolase)